MNYNKLLVLIKEGKGGVGKSLIAQIMAATLRDGGKYSVGFINSDTTNSTTSSIEQTRFADLSKTETRGVVLNCLQALANGTFDSMVWDSGARDEARIVEILPWLTKEIKSMGGQLVVVRPITLSTAVQTNAVTFMAIAKKLGIAVIFARNLGQGRTAEHFLHWDATSARANALDAGAIEVALSDAGARWGDEAGGFGLSLSDVALGEFSKAREDADEAAKIFDEDVRSWLSIWLSETVDDFRAALIAALDRVNEEHLSQQC